ncbi:MAG TPA: cell envelope integrity protein CreD [Spirochaetota bacterium]|nr:cell envelope integrity protein CreD [Spirochaetota bacterium]HOD15502.1 cell envelope integrity protein CreD [Spirochaetota bacterium]HPG52432.1 cell envelope integrity protein CreD [Spirochaetota bacterium]HPN11993.1 cell envelope integrity protein CreD [Spirochaetota bacterium]HQL82340.1 cell envelope integrity protein CreD [Spirochaetota bacterium]
MKSQMLKTLVVGFLALAMLIPVQMVRSLVNERMERRDELVKQMGKVWGAPHVLKGAYLFKKDGNLYPDEITVSGAIVPDLRKKGIFMLPFYTSSLNIKGMYKNPVNTSAYRRIAVRINDAAGVRIKNAWWGPGKIPCSSWMSDNDTIIIQVPEKAGVGSFEIDLVIRGIESLQFFPLARKTSIRITSQWEDPNFIGAIMPTTRDLSGTGFDAFWNVETERVSVPEDDDEGASFGVNLFLPVDIYTLIDRTTKYAVLFIALTFVAFFLFEVLNRVKVHPFQYLMVGLALSIFYLLLLSLSEHIGFTVSYVIATVAVVALITWYCLRALRSTRHALITGSLITLLYILLFVLLRLETYALLVGSIGLFTILAAIMFMTRNIDWYSSRHDIQPGPDEKKSL